MDMTSIFASVYDNCRNIILILTGSEIGVFYDFLALEDANSALFGRAKKKSKLIHYPISKVLNFLK